MTDGPRTPRTSLIVASLLSIVLAGCLGAGPAARAEAPTTYAFPEPARGGRWRLRLADGGQEVSTVQLVGSREYARDGTRRHAPVLRISSDPLRLPDGIHFQTRYWVHQLGPQGVVDTRAEADLVSDVGGTTSRIEMDLLDGVPDPGHDRPFASAYLYGPGLWGRTLTVGEPVAVPEAMVSGWDRETGPPFFEVTSVSGGCATVRADAPSLALRVEADLVFCDGPLPERIDVLSPARRSYVVDRIHVGDPSPDPVSNTVPLREPVGTFPPDGSDLPFPLDEAADAIHAHPATTAWLDRHPDARAVQGRLTATACRVHDGTVTAVPGTCPDLYRARALEWRVVLASPSSQT